MIVAYVGLISMFTLRICVEMLSLTRPKCLDGKGIDLVLYLDIREA